MNAADDTVLKALSAACPAARPAEPADAVAGAAPRFAAAPANLQEASALMRAASEHGLATVPRGTGTKLAWGAPPRRCDLVVDMSGLNRVVEHAAGDLVARVEAGARMETVAEVLRRSGQQLALDPAPRPGDGGPSGTVGGALATGAAGPRRLRYGTPRDLIIGVTVVRADGAVARSGGKVVKNVAGYDLGKLFAGSYGTLGLIVEAVVRLHPRPAAVAYACVDCAGPADAAAAVARAAGSELAPAAIEVDRPGAGRPVRVAVLLEGDPAEVEDRGALMAGLLGPGAWMAPDAPPWWGRLEVAGAGPHTLIRLAFWSAALPRIFSVIDAAAAAAGLEVAVGGSPAAGVLYAGLGADADPEAVAGFVSGLRTALARGDGDARPAGAPSSAFPAAGASAVVLTAPPAVADRVDLWGPAPSLALMRAVKDQFDPAHLMSPGRFAGGI